MPFPGDPDGHPGKDEVAAYLEAYAERFDLPVRLGCRVTSVRPETPVGAPVETAVGAPAGFAVETTAGPLRAAQVVVAAGAFHTPRTPAFAAGLAPHVVQTHSTGYRSPDRLAGDDVLVVGAGNTGVQIARELAESGRRVSLAASAVGRALPQRVLGRDLFWWFDRIGFMDVRGRGRLGRRLREQELIIGTDVSALMRRVRRFGRAVDADGARHRPDAVVWATGFVPRYPWLHVPVLDDGGAPVHDEGTTAWPGLHFLGLPWQRDRGSSVLGWVGRDAAVLARRLTATTNPVKTVVSP
ncbi:NAD(P)-binding domain-containing protein [Planomonospora corallina]|uniref:NAD(P)-binding domain-containing protein n=1 Tax=Planomonospora corallina TaxID=1806052 RepID=A0ABV8I3G8_9ACTN